VKTFLVKRQKITTENWSIKANSKAQAEEFCEMKKGARSLLGTKDLGYSTTSVEEIKKG